MKSWRGLILLIIVIFLGHSVLQQTDSQGTFRAVLHQEGEEITQLEILAPYDTTELILEIYDQDQSLSHYFVLNTPLGRKQGETYYQSYMISNKAVDFEKMNRIKFYSNNNEETLLERGDMEMVDAPIKSFEGKGSQAGDRISLTIMSYNIHHGKSLTGRETLDEIKTVIEESGASIIGLQEVDSHLPRSKMKNQIKVLGEALGMEYAYGENLSLFGGRYGNGILSKYPILSVENILLPGSREQRGLLSVTLDVEGHPIHFLVTHLGLGEKEQREQVKAISNYLDNLSGDIILVGDFNTTQEEGILRVLDRQLVDLGRAAGMDQVPTFDYPLHSKRIDYIFVSNGHTLLNYQVIKSRASDHYPVLGTIALTKNY